MGGDTGKNLYRNFTVPGALGLGIRKKKPEPAQPKSDLQPQQTGLALPTQTQPVSGAGSTLLS